MRIISGKYKGRRINAPKNLPVRPTTDMSKEALFNVLNNHFNFSELRILDLFAGTGNISYEFASRGAQKITAVDLSFKCVEFIKSMKQKHTLNNLDVLKKDAFTFLKSALTKFDIIFTDAPYAHREINLIPKLVAERKLLHDNGWLIVEHENTLDLDNEPNFTHKRVYGQSCFSFFSAGV